MTYLGVVARSRLSLDGTSMDNKQGPLNCQLVEFQVYIFDDAFQDARPVGQFIVVKFLHGPDVVSFTYNIACKERCLPVNCIDHRTVHEITRYDILDNVVEHLQV